MVVDVVVLVHVEADPGALVPARAPLSGCRRVPGNGSGPVDVRGRAKDGLGQVEVEWNENSGGRFFRVGLWWPRPPPSSPTGSLHC